MVWQPEIEEIERKKQLAAVMGGPERIDRHHSDGKLKIRVRIDQLLGDDSISRSASSPGTGSSTPSAISSASRRCHM